MVEMDMEQATGMSERSNHTSGSGGSSSLQSDSRPQPSTEPSHPPSINTESKLVNAPRTTSSRRKSSTSDPSGSGPSTQASSKPKTSTYKRKSRAKVHLAEDGSGEGGVRGKQTRQSQSCDGCRVRKVKCIPLDANGANGEKAGLGTLGEEDEDSVERSSEAGMDDGAQSLSKAGNGKNGNGRINKTNPISAMSEGSGGLGMQKPRKKGTPIVPCKACNTLGLVCTFDYVPRKRGPPNLYMKRLRDASNADGPMDPNLPRPPSRPDLPYDHASSSNGLPPLSASTTQRSSYSHSHPHSHPYPYPSASDFLPRLGGGETKPTLSFIRDSRSSSPVRKDRNGSSYPAHLNMDKLMGPPIPNLQVHDGPYLSASAINGSKMNLDNDTMLGAPAPSPSETGLSSIMRYPTAGISPMGGPYEHALTPTSSFLRSTAVDDPGEEDSRRYGSMGDDTRSRWPSSATPRLPALDLKGNFLNPNESQYYSSPSDVMDERSSLADSSKIQTDGRDARIFMSGESSGLRSGSIDGPSEGLRGIPLLPPISSALQMAADRFSMSDMDAFSGLHQQGDRLWMPSSGPLSSFARPGSNGTASGSRGGVQQSPISSLMNIGSFSGPSAPTLNPLDAYVPRSLLHLIIGLFFDYIYPLIPCLHRPTFYHDLMNKREERPGEEEWTSLVLAVIASTLVQVPKAFVPLSRKEVRDLAYKCYQGIRMWSLDGHKNVTVMTVTITYLMTVYNFVRGEHASCHASLGETQALCTFLRLHEEESYMYLNPIERELRRRIFFLTFGADKSEAVLLGRPSKMREEDCYALRLPEEIDDEFITATSYLSQPMGVTSLITGFNAATRIMCLIGRVMLKHREDKRDPPSGARLQSRLDEVSRLLDEIMSVMDHCPPSLRLKSGLDSRAQSPAGGWDTEASAQLQALFFDPTTDRRKAKDAFLVQQGNIYVTQQLGRFVLLQYRNDLLALRNGGSAPNTTWQSIGGVPLGAVGSAGAGPTPADNEKLDREGLCYDMLTVLHSLPIQCIAVNGPSLVAKVRYQAASLLDSVAVNANKDESRGETDSSATIRAQTYLLEFLSILSEVEKHYLLDDDGLGS